MKKNTRYQQPPRFASLIFKKMFPDNDKYTTLGDLEEEYRQLFDESGQFQAWWWYWRQVLIIIPHFIFNFFLWRIIMFKNFIKIAFRNILRNKIYSAISIFGLAVGLTVCFYIFFWVRHELSYDSFHKQAPNIYRALFVKLNDQNQVVEKPSPEIPGAVAPAFIKDFPEVINAVRFRVTKLRILRYKDRVFYESNGFYVDPSFFNIFSFEILESNEKNPLSDPSGIVITEGLKKKYFLKENPLGKIMKMGEKAFTVTAVMKDLPSNSHLSFDFLCSTMAMEGDNKSYLTDWSSDAIPTYFLIQPGTDIEAFTAKMNAYIYDKTPLLKQMKFGFRIQPLLDIHLKEQTRFEYANVGDTKYIYIFSLVALLILFIACINFVNLILAQSLKKIHLNGIKMVLGANRGKIMADAFGESFVQFFMAYIFSIVIIIYTIPLYIQLSGKPMLWNWNDGMAIIVISVLLLFTSLIIGIYPTIYHSSFKLTETLRNKSFLGNRRTRLRQALVIVQFTISVFLIISTLVIKKQIHFMQNQNLAMNKHMVLHVPVRGNLNTTYGILKQQLSGDNNILAITYKSCLPFDQNDSGPLAKEGMALTRGPITERVWVDHDYFKTMKMKITKGRTFSTAFGTDRQGAGLFYETSARELGIQQNPLGKRVFFVRRQKQERVVIGIVKDTYTKSLHYAIHPQIYLLDTYQLSTGQILIRLGNNIPSALSSIKLAWNMVNPQVPMEYHFLNESYEQLYHKEQDQFSLFSAFSGIAVVLSALGLFGLSFFMGVQRTREFGIRKVMGATGNNIFLMLAREFNLWTLIANLIAWPLSYLFIQNWLNHFAYRTSFGILPFILSLATTAIVTLITISWQSFRAATVNPVDSIRYE